MVYSIRLGFLTNINGDRRINLPQTCRSKKMSSSSRKSVDPLKVVLLVLLAIVAPVFARKLPADTAAQEKPKQTAASEREENSIS